MYNLNTNEKNNPIVTAVTTKTTNGGRAGGSRKK